MPWRLVPGSATTNARLLHPRGQQPLRDVTCAPGYTGFNECDPRRRRRGRLQRACRPSRRAGQRWFREDAHSHVAGPPSPQAPSDPCRSLDIPHHGSARGAVRGARLSARGSRRNDRGRASGSVARGWKFGISLLRNYFPRSRSQRMRALISAGGARYSRGVTCSIISRCVGAPCGTGPFTRLSSGVKTTSGGA